jgi:S-(hydroxymethyl)glutathione dehydrogenase/alcohol dehydrogenase
MTAALVARSTDAAPAVEDIVLPPVAIGQVRVRIRAAGVCHSDLSMVNGTLRTPYPLVLGHEAAGEIVEVGLGVAGVRPGQHVVLNWSPACRQCWFCVNGEPWLCVTSGTAAVARGRTADGSPLHVALGLGAFADEVVVDRNAVIGVPTELAWECAALIGCAVLTGTGAVCNTARVTPGVSVAVIGLGGVGLSVVTAARAAGADPVIAVDVSDGKRALAEAAGATDFRLAGDTLSTEIRTLTEGRGVDHAFECVGRSTTIRAAWRATRRGGRVTVVGMGASDDMVQLSALDVFTSARTVSSSVYGSSDPELDVPALAAAVLDGSLDLSYLITDRIGLADVPAAFDRMARGEGARSVVLL